MIEVYWQMTELGKELPYIKKDFDKVQGKEVTYKNTYEKYEINKQIHLTKFTIVKGRGKN